MSKIDELIAAAAHEFQVIVESKSHPDTAAYVQEVLNYRLRQEDMQEKIRNFLKEQMNILLYGDTDEMDR